MVGAETLMFSAMLAQFQQELIQFAVSALVAVFLYSVPA